jgi:hypothetical protein
MLAGYFSFQCVVLLSRYGKDRKQQLPAEDMGSATKIQDWVKDISFPVAFELTKDHDPETIKKLRRHQVSALLLLFNNLITLEPTKPQTRVLSVL